MPLPPDKNDQNRAPNKSPDLDANHETKTIQLDASDSKQRKAGYDREHPITSAEADHTRPIEWVEAAAVDDKEAKRLTDIRNQARAGTPYAEVARKNKVPVSKVLEVIGADGGAGANMEDEFRELDTYDRPQYVISPGPSVTEPPIATLPAERK